MTRFRLKAATIVAEHQDFSDGILEVAGEAIQAVGPCGPNDVDVIDLDDAWIIPGLIDLHIHGRAGRDVMDADPVSLAMISTSLAKHGVTGFLATTATAGWDRTLAALRVVGELVGKPLPGARLLGAYSEGLFFNEKHKGAHNAAFFLELTNERIDAMVDAAGGHLKVLALAPERPGALDCIKHAAAQGIRVVLGHTDATYEQTVQALEAGASGGVHVFNGMRGIHHRDPGCAGAVLLHPATVEVIADGVHLHPAILAMIARLKKPDEILLISDCMCAGGLADGPYRLGEMDVRVCDGIVRTEAGGLAGSTLTLELAISRMAQDAGLTFREATALASMSPARFLDIDDQAGSLAPGKRADFAILDSNRKVRATCVGGRFVWCDADWSLAHVINTLGRSKSF